METLTAEQLVSQYNKGRRDFSNVDLSGQFIKGWKDEYLNLQGINLSNACLEKTHFDFVNFKHADFTNANIIKGAFKYCNLRGTFLNGNLLDALFLDCDIRFANLQESTLCDTKFHICDLRFTDFSYRNLKWYKQPKMEIWLSNIKYANFTQVDLCFTTLRSIKGLYTFLDYGGSNKNTYCIKQPNTWQILHYAFQDIVLTYTLEKFEQIKHYPFGGDNNPDNLSVRKCNVELLKTLK